MLRNSFYGREDHGLVSRLIEELPGIFLWSLEGFDRLRERGAFRQPDSARDALDELEALGSPILAFIKDRCVVAPGLACDTAEMFAAWQDWCNADNRRESGTVQTFGRNLRAAVPGLEIIQFREVQKRVRRYEGIELQ